MGAGMDKRFRGGLKTTDKLRAEWAILREEMYAATIRGYHDQGQSKVYIELFRRVLAISEKFDAR